MVELRQYQIEAINKAKTLINNYGLAYLFGDMRIGKTIIALSIAKELGKTKVLFVTKKMAMQSIIKDAKMLNMTITVINYESVSKVGNDFDIVILDESHRLKAFPKASKGAKDVFAITKKGMPIIYLSGTPAIESGSGLYHQFKMSVNSPFKQWASFYKWADAGFVNKVQKRIPTGFITDYSNTNLTLLHQYTDHLVVRITQEDAGFESKLSIEEVYLDTPDLIKMLTKNIIKDGIFIGENTEIVADSAIKKLQKVHQLIGGTVITEDGVGRILNTYRAEYILNNYKNKKIAIFYTYRAERQMLLNTIPNIVETPEEFNTIKDSIFIGQIKSASEGVNLSSAEYLIFMSIMYSGTAYVQALDRASYKGRLTPPKIVFILSTDGIDRQILDAVRNKQVYNTQLFKKQYKII